VSPSAVVILGLTSAILGAVSVLIPLALTQVARNRRYRRYFAAFAKDIEAFFGQPLSQLTADDVNEWHDAFWREHRHDLTTRERLARAFLNAESPRGYAEDMPHKRIWSVPIMIDHAGPKPKDVYGRVDRFLSSPFVPDFVKHEFMFMLERLAQLRPTTAPHDPDASLTAAFIVDRIESITGSLCKTQAIAEGWRYVIEPEIARCERAYGKLVHVRCVHDAMPSFLHMRSSEQ